MFVRSDDTINLVDDPNAAPEDQNVLILQRRINLKQYGLLMADDLAIRMAQNSYMMVAQQMYLYLCYYLVGWRGPNAPRDEHGTIIPPSHELIAQLDYNDDLVYAALQKAEQLYMDQFIADPTAQAKKKPKEQTPTTRAGRKRLARGQTS